MNKFTDPSGREIVDLDIFVPEMSSVDAFIESAVYMDTRKKVPDDVLEYLNEAYSDYVQDYAYRNGSRNHN